MNDMKQIGYTFNTIRPLEKCKVPYVEFLKQKNIDFEDKYTEFPYRIETQGYNYELDLIEDIIWKTIGPMHGECSKEYYYGSDMQWHEGWICPDADIDEDFWEKMWDQSSILRNYYSSREEFFKDHPHPQTYEHSHYGDWIAFGCHKIGYDYNRITYAFRDIVDYERCMTKIILGPQFEIMEKQDDH